MAFTLRQINSQPFQLPESSRVKAANDAVFELPKSPQERLKAEPRKPKPTVGINADPQERSSVPAGTTDTTKTKTDALLQAGLGLKPRGRQRFRFDALLGGADQGVTAPEKPAQADKPVQAEISARAEKPARADKPAQAEKSAQAKQPAQRQEQVQAQPEKQASAPVIPPNVKRESILDARNRFNKMESMIALAGFGIIVSVLAFAWVSWDKDYAIVGDYDVAYNYGLTGGLMLLGILIYSLRKRVKFMRRMGDITYWYYAHFSLGIIAPVLIVLHTSFELRSVNATMAFIALLMVVCSGFLGRYIYTRASYGVQFLEREMKNLTEARDGGIFQNKQSAMLELEKSISGFCDWVVVPPNSVMKILSNLVSVKIRCHRFHKKVNRELSDTLASLMMTEKWTDSQLQIHHGEEQQSLADHMKLVASISVAQTFEKLAAKWRLLHVPILYLLALSVGAHVLAVHMY